MSSGEWRDEALDSSAGDSETVGAERFAHGALSHLLTSPRAVDDRIAAALQQIDASRRLARSSLLVAGAAAAVFFVFVLAWGVPESPSLLADVRRLAVVAEEATDRSYALRLTDEDGQLLSGTMTSRGATAFVVELELRAGTLSFGFDGERSWMVPPRPRMPVRVGTGVARVRRALARGQRIRMPFFVLASILEQLPGNYDLSRSDASAGADALAFHAVRRAAGGNGDLPAVIDVTSDPETAVVQFMRLEWPGSGSGSESRPQPSPGSGAPIRGSSMRSFELRLLSEERRDAVYYRHTSHHLPGRRVVEFR